MSLILNIETSLETAFVCIAENGIPIQARFNTIQKEHAGFLHHAITELTQELKINLSDISAIAVTEGPGSYTGLRVGMASAKGLCYALKKHFITIGALTMQAKAAAISINGTDNILFCPVIDARRMEVFTAVYDSKINELSPPAAMILTTNSFAEILNKNQVYFLGSGTQKLQQVLSHENAHFLQLTDFVAGMSQLSHEKFFSGDFTDLAHSEPLYVKEFFSS